MAVLEVLEEGQVLEARLDLELADKVIQVVLAVRIM
jgi:hypothetical protein